MCAGVQYGSVAEHVHVMDGVFRALSAIKVYCSPVMAGQASWVPAGIPVAKVSQYGGWLKGLMPPVMVCLMKWSVKGCASPAHAAGYMCGDMSLPSSACALHSGLRSIMVCIMR